MTWHVDGGTLEGYLDGHLTDALACSLEAHLLACEQCRADLASATSVRGRRTHEQSWDQLMDQVDRPTGNRVVRGLEKWLPPHLLRLVAAAPALRNAACAAGFAMLAATVLAAHFRSGPLGTLAFLITAPVVPLVGVALAYSHPDDLCGEVADALPYSRFKLLLLRTAAVASLTLPVVVVLSLLLPVDLRLALLWLAPSLAMCALTLALSPFADSRWVAAGLGLLWLVATTVHLPAAAPFPSLHELLAREFVFRPGGQVFLLVLALLAVTTSAVLRRTTFETRTPA